MIQVKLESGEVILCEKLIGVAFRSDGKVYHITDGPLNLIDVLYTKDIMGRHEEAIVNQELRKRTAKANNKKILVPVPSPQS